MKKLISGFCALVLLLAALATPAAASAASSLSLRTGNGKTSVIAKTNFKVVWNAVDNAKNYQIKVVDDTVGKTLVNKKVTGTSYTVSGSSIEYARRIVITVTALNKSGKKLASETIVVSSSAGPGSCTTKSASVKKGGKVVFTFSVDTNGGSKVKDCGVVINGRKYSYGALGTIKGTFSMTLYFSAGKYSWQAYVTNDYGTVYGKTKTFTVSKSLFGYALPMPPCQTAALSLAFA